MKPDYVLECRISGVSHGTASPLAAAGRARTAGGNHPRNPGAPQAPAPERALIRGAPALCAGQFGGRNGDEAMKVSELFPPSSDLCQRDETAFVYVIAMLTPFMPVFKIGMSRDVNTRVAQIESILPYPCLLMFVLWAKDASALELSLHQCFAEYRVSGEWFELPEDCLVALDRVADAMVGETPTWALKHLRTTRPEEWHEQREKVLRDAFPGWFVPLATTSGEEPSG